MSEFKSFGKIPALENSPLRVRITQKIHGTNAQIYIYPQETYTGEEAFGIKAGSRSRWLTAEDDNHGFAKWVDEHHEFLIKFLGPGRHYGEWAGKGINRGEGLDRKRFFLFDEERFRKNLTRLDNADEIMSVFLELGISSVPVLVDMEFIKFSTENLMTFDTVLDRLKEMGSLIKEGYMFPEGIVIEIYDAKRVNPSIFLKKTFDKEDVAWEGKKEKVPGKPLVDVSHLLQPGRLQNILSREERYTRDYPNTLGEIANLYLEDLYAEGFLCGNDEEFRAKMVNDIRTIVGTLKEIKRSLGKNLYRFIRSQMEHEFDEKELGVVEDSSVTERGAIKNV